MVLLEQPDLGQPGASRRLRFGEPSAPTVAILNGKGSWFEGGSDNPDLSLKWVPRGSADYRTEGRAYRLSGATQLLLNRGQPYRMNMRGESETFVLFFPKTVADAAWRAHSDSGDAMPEIPTAAAPPPRALQQCLFSLQAESRTLKPDADLLRELCVAVLGEIVSLAALRRGQAFRINARRRTTREELLRRLLRAETYLRDAGHRATLSGAADAAALSPFHLIRIFKNVFNETPLAYGARTRLQAAHADLVRTRRPIAEIAEAAGYESRTAFDRAFARQFGTTPGAVRAAAV